VGWRATEKRVEADQQGGKARLTPSARCEPCHRATLSCCRVAVVQFVRRPHVSSRQCAAHRVLRCRQQTGNMQHPPSPCASHDVRVRALVCA
jgi:hypothetical protein